MLRWLRSGMWWIPLVFAVLIGGVGTYAYQALSESTHTQLERELSTILRADIEALELWIEGQKAIARGWAGNAELVAHLQLLKEAARGSDEPRDALRASPALGELGELLQPVVEASGLLTFVVLDRNALVLADSHGALLGRRLAVHRDNWERILAGETTFTRPKRDVLEGTLAFRDIVFYSVAPILDGGGVAGVLGFVVPASGGFSKILQIARMGESGETYAFDESGAMLSQSRFLDQLVALGLLPEDPAEQVTTSIQIRDPGGNMVEGFVPELPVLARPLTRMAADAVTGRSGSDVNGYRDYRGVEVIGAWTWVPELRLGVTTEIDRAEAYTGLDTLRRIFAVLAAALALGAVGMLLYSMLLGRVQTRFDKARKLGRYQIIEKIGEGGMGKVYRAKHALLRRPTAVKLLEPGKASADAIKRFEREVQAAASLTHPNTISIFDYGHTPDGTFYYAMEYLEGVDLAELVAFDGAQPEARVVHIMKQAAASLAEAHAVGLVHRDLKPSNVMLCQRGGMYDFAKVLDFGLVRSEERADELTLTNVSSLTGTPLYLSPEALESPETVSARSDVYQLGAIAYYMLTGRHVFTGETLVEVLSQHLNKPPIPPSEVLGHPISAELEALVLACLAKAPSDRPRSGSALLEELEQCPVEGSWTQRDAREWWEDHATARAAMTSEGAKTGALPSGWQIELDGRTTGGSS